MSITQQQAREAFDAIRSGMASKARVSREAYRGLYWRVLGYESWPQCWSEEVGDEFEVKVDAEDRRAVVARLRSEGMTQQAIADALGVSKATVCGDVDELFKAEQLDDVPEQPDTVVGKDGKTYPVRKRVAPAQDKVIDYLRDHPDATPQQVVRDLGVGWNAVYTAAKECGYIWPSNRNRTRDRIVEYIRKHPHATITEVAEACGSSKRYVGAIGSEIGHIWANGRSARLPAPAPIDAPGHTFANEPKQVLHMRRMCDALASDNGRMHYAQHLSAAIREEDDAWIDEQRQALEYVLAYIGDFLRCHTDEGFRKRLNSGWEGRDDIAEQQVTTQRLRVVSAR